MMLHWYQAIIFDETRQSITGSVCPSSNELIVLGGVSSNCWGVNVYALCGVRS